MWLAIPGQIKELGDGEASLAAPGRGLTVWTNHQVPANDGGISLGQAALSMGLGRTS